MTPDMLPVTPGTVQETWECYLKTASLQGVPRTLLIAPVSLLFASPSSSWNGISETRVPTNPHEDYFSAYSNNITVLNLLMSNF